MNIDYKQKRYNYERRIIEKTGEFKGRVSGWSANVK
jgi:hypothetical protein